MKKLERLSLAHFSKNELEKKHEAAIVGGWCTVYTTYDDTYNATWGYNEVDTTSDRDSTGDSYKEFQEHGCGY